MPDLTRRGMFGFVAAAPIVGPAIARAVATPIAEGGLVGTFTQGRMIFGAARESAGIWGGPYGFSEFYKTPLLVRIEDDPVVGR